MAVRPNVITPRTVSTPNFANTPQQITIASNSIFANGRPGIEFQRDIYLLVISGMFSFPMVA